MLKFVTVLVAAVDVDEDGSCESGSRFVASDEDRDEMIEQARDEAIERYGENIGPLPLRHRIVVHEVEFPMLKQPQTVKATLAELPDEPVRATVA